MAKKKGITMSERYAWIIVRKSNDSIVEGAGIEFEQEENKCPENVKVNPVYKDEYENKRVLVTYSRIEK